MAKGVRRSPRNAGGNKRGGNKRGGGRPRGGNKRSAKRKDVGGKQVTPKKRTRKDTDADVKLKIGMVVKAKADGGKKWYKATVMKVNKSKKSGGALTYDLKYEDGDREKHVKRSLIRVLHEAAAPGKLLVGFGVCTFLFFSFLSFCTTFTCVCRHYWGR